jgi:Rieske Fe-S protein
MKFFESMFSRRRFLDALIGVGGSGLFAYLLYPLCRFVWGNSEIEPESVVLKDFTDPEQGTAIYFKYGAHPAFIFRTDTNDLRAFTAVCTHLNCTVQYDAAHKRIWCACHQGVFDLDGRQISGPPPRPLKQYYVERRGKDLFVALNRPAKTT